MDGMTEFLAGVGDATQASWHPLPDENWEEEITAQVYRLLPPDLRVRVQLKWNKENRKAGYAMGSVLLADSSGSVKAMMPLIVKQNAMAPLDIIVANKRFLPYTEDRLHKLFDDGSVADKLVPYRDAVEYADQDLSQEIRPHTPGVYVFSADTREMLETRSTEDVADLRTWMLQQPEMLAKISNIHRDQQVIARITPPELAKIAAAQEVITWEKTADGKFKVLMKRHDQFGPQVIDAGDGELRVSLKENVPGSEKDEWLGRVYGEERATLAEKDKELDEQLPSGDGEDGGTGSDVLLYRTEWREPEAGKKFGPAFAMTTSGARIRGVLYPDVVGFNGRKVKTKIFVGRSWSGMQPNIAVQPLDMTSRVEEPSADDDMPVSGQTGIFVHTQDDKTVALLPITLTSISTRDRRWALTDSEDRPMIVGSDDSDPSERDASVLQIRARGIDGVDVELIVSPHTKGIIETTPKWWKDNCGYSGSARKRYVISGDFRWVVLNEFRELMETPDQITAQERMQKVGSNRLRLVHSNGSYELQAPWARKLQTKLAAENCPIHLDNLSPGEAEHMLACWGIHTKLAHSVVDGASRLGAVTVHGVLDPLRVAHEKTAAAEPTYAPELLETLTIVKTAARRLLPNVVTYYPWMEKRGAPDDTVENVLDLNFLNPQNLAYFIGALPKLRAVQDILGRLLIATRVGLPDVEEETVRATLKQLDAILKGLSSLAYTDDDE